MDIQSEADDQIPTATATAPPTAPDQSRRAAIAGYVGSTLEYYDFFIYASAAALVFDEVFFSAAGELSLLLSLSTIGISWLIRPLGAVLWGHFGDRLSRKQVLVLTLLMMGTATFLIGFIPSYDSIGVAAPVLLVLMLMLQGLSAAGETAGASSLVVEASDDSRRAFNSSWIQTGNLTGFILATFVFIPVAALPREQLLTWGWRVPFLASLVLVVVALIIRRSLQDPQVFTDARSTDEGERRSPLRELMTTHRGALIRVGALGLFQGTHAMVTVFGLAYATDLVGVSDSTMLWVLVAVSILALATVPLGGLLSDRFGRRPVFLGGCVSCVVAFGLYMYALSTGATVSIVITALVVYGLAYSIGNGSTMALFAEQFPVRVRYSGLAVGLQLSGLVYGFAPSIALWLLGGSASLWLLAVAVEAVLCGAALVAVLSAREAAFTPIDRVGVETH